jgi:hypothetical protein
MKKMEFINKIYEKMEVFDLSIDNQLIVNLFQKR